MTKDFIHRVQGKSKLRFSLPELRESFWLNMYIPGITMQNVFILPIIYVIALVLFTQFIFSPLVFVFPSPELVVNEFPALNIFSPRITP